MSDPVPTLRFCPRCFRAEDETGPELCANFTLGCPPMVEKPITQVVELDCAACAIHRIIPVSEIMHNRGRPEGRCVTDVCVAHQVLPVSAELPNLPPPLGASEPTPKASARKPHRKG